MNNRWYCGLQTVSSPTGFLDPGAFLSLKNTEQSISVLECTHYPLKYILLFKYMQ